MQFFPIDTPAATAAGAQLQMQPQAQLQALVQQQQQLQQQQFLQQQLLYQGYTTAAGPVMQRMATAAQPQAGLSPQPQAQAQALQQVQQQLQQLQQQQQQFQAQFQQQLYYGMGDLGRPVM